MFLSRLRIRGKLTLLVVIPLLAMAGLALPIIRSLVNDAGQAREIDVATTVAGRVGSLLADLQRERLLSIGYLLGVVTKDDLELQSAATTDRAHDVQQELGSTLPSQVRAEIGGVAKLNPLRQRVLSRTTTPDQVLDEFTPLLDDMIDSLRLPEYADSGTDAGRQLNALDALLRLDESNTESTALLAVMAGGKVKDHSVRYREERTEYETYLDRFDEFATSSERDLYSLVAAAFRDRLGKDFDAKFVANPTTTMAALPVATLFPALRSFSVLGTFVKKGLVDDVTSSVARQRQQQLTAAYGAGALVVMVLLIVLILVAVVARAVAVPLTQLSLAAARVAEAGETELQRVADDESETVEPVYFEDLDMNSHDEIGDLARVFERVQNTASLLVERQVLSRRNVAEMFGHIGRRTQNLVGGQVSLIDELENEETSPERLAKLYRLDHIANRLRRSADSLVVISGADREEIHRSPVRLVDVARLALAEIEEYNRVDVDIPLGLSMAPALVSDLVLICGELLENATNFSPPHTRVRVSARTMPGGVRLIVADHGIGMPGERLAEENARIARRERLDLVPTQVLGLFVVGRLARRHNLTVALSQTPGGGVTVEVSIGDALLAGEPAVVSTAPVAPAAVPEPRQITVAWAPPAWGDTGPAAVAPAPDRSSLEPVPRHPVEKQSDVREAMNRVQHVMRDQHPWNGFEVTHGLPGSPPPPPEMPTRIPVRRETPVAGQPHSPVRAAVPATAAPTSMSGLRQRVPGAQLPEVTKPSVSDHVPVVADAIAARAFAEAFEYGVTRALHDTSPDNRQ
ncbi:sensor histidine kinase [Actinoplanes palleronii]|uniref:histidine kinase n=1 Tax=Actinoplanes palleronii TaxID=113570 RepID=A0ABQ4B6D3_9ACTN|nr:nitrate- and nitrite sensing domain-containing protein [Actinoplanes palleronii]GIE66215.1 histidine kinase [Actinoplanes palleronii]